METMVAKFEDLKSKQSLINLEVNKASNIETYFSNGQTILDDSELIKNEANLLEGISVSLTQNAETNLQLMKSNHVLATQIHEKFKLIKVALKKGTGVVDNRKADCTNIIELISIAKTEVYNA